MLGGEVLDPTKTLGELELTAGGCLLKVEYEAESLFEYSSVSGILKGKEGEKEAVTSVGLFRSFEKQGGVEKIIEVVIQSINLWKNKEIAKRWLQYVQ